MVYTLRGDMKQKDIFIISCLRDNARMPLTMMSKKLNIPVSTIFDRLKIQEKDIILKHTSLLDFNKIGYNLRANVTIKTNSENKEELRNFLIRHPSVNSAYKISNEYDFMLEVIFREMREMGEFIDELDMKFPIIEKKILFITEDIIRESFMTEKNILS